MGPAQHWPLVWLWGAQKINKCLRISWFNFYVIKPCNFSIFTCLKLNKTKQIKQKSQCKNRTRQQQQQTQAHNQAEEIQSTVERGSL